MTTTLPTPATAPAGSPPDSRAGAAALVAAGISVAVGVTQVLYPQDTDPAIDPRTAALLVATSLMLWALPVLYLRLAALAGTRWPAVAASAGTVLLSGGMLSSAVNGEDLSFFPAVALVANALWFLGSLALAVALWRSRRVSRPLVALLPLVTPVFLFLSQTGGGVPVGAYLAVVGWLLLRGQLDRRA
ncbi:hypothetical protein SAMN04488107_0936 [Geodermatophilus saharensis]|uniref:Uncharacterized protein n=1 Tax=Geodermatophilus saharensis TaxID=1137994 RepID=A0A239B737_9ACTN|nr:hypothetical protein [Geodermatophilus saharensis]SNS03013.1 hypothetical protein SAMN04488107_0936 [Geodermatophilus saharensis]